MGEMLAPFFWSLLMSELRPKGKADDADRRPKPKRRAGFGGGGGGCSSELAVSPVRIGAAGKGATTGGGAPAMYD